MYPSDKMQVTGGTLEQVVVAALSLSFLRRSQNGVSIMFFMMLSQREGMSWVESASDGGRPSGMVSNLKSGKPSCEFEPRDLRKRLWLNSVLRRLYENFCGGEALQV